LLVELAVQVEADRVSVVPYHSHSVHQVVDTSEGLVLVRPGRRHARYAATFGRDVAELERLLNAPAVKERDIDAALTANPLFLRAEIALGLRAGGSAASWRSPSAAGSHRRAGR